MATRILPIVIGAAVLGFGAHAASAGTLDDVKAKGFVQCGVNGSNLAGFGAQDSSGNWTGLDADLCKGVAAAVFGDATKVKFTPLSAKDRFPALQSGEIDMLARNTTWSASRDSQLGFDFRAINYYDGQGFMVKKELGVKSALELNGASVCVQSGTTTELNLADYFRANKMEFKPVVFEAQDEADAAYNAGRCDVYTTDQSGLYSIRLKMANPDDHVVLPEIISKEPLGPAVRQNDSKWFDVVSFTHYAMITAEEFGITQANIEEMKKTENPDIKRFLGEEANNTIGADLGLPNDWAVQVIKAVGNYGEVFERNVGKGSPLKIERGLNALWNKGGLQYAPPIR
ncbi:amino acid ABC transporter substrate-bindnig protein [Rhizobium sp. Leaf371]|uniref:amino acid ABC transporter substrate-binding protein n=1 Tax=Rhizobium sp. Leaf371 TaxID=1736355 RepID=UPI0007124255|nr:amino acid ABC transporter substrate-binding protein [Rhizobium sp. Leaf371]KQS72818.1 amino acid ABC transporter substrate-bindnig protein [Rhizobium sp. Leaf371]